MSANRVLLFAKAPVAGRVKTRLIPLVGENLARRLHLAFLQDIVERLRRTYDVVLYHHPEQPGPDLLGLDVELRPQRGQDLGKRLENAFEEQSGERREGVVILGSDSPDLSMENIDRAFVHLKRAELVLGPAVDGGYYLIGACGVPRSVLRGIPWGSSEVLEASLMAIRKDGLESEILDVWYDVDRPEDLSFLKVHLELLLAARGEDRCPRTRRLLAEIPALS